MKNGVEMDEDLEYKGGTRGEEGRGVGESTVSNHHTGQRKQGEVNRCRLVCGQQGRRLLGAFQQVREELRRGQALQDWTAYWLGLLVLWGQDKVGLANAGFTWKHILHNIVYNYPPAEPEVDVYVSVHASTHWDIVSSTVLRKKSC